MSMIPRDWRSEKCTVEQRQEIERRAREKRMRWSGVIQIASKISGRSIRDTGELTKGEASDLINELGDE